MEQSLKGIAKTAGRSREKETKKKPEGEAYSAAVITIRDKGTKEDHSDERGRAAVQMLQEEGYEIAETMIISDEPDILKRELIRLADQCCVDLIITSGGTGFAMRDRTPEITMEVADRNAPGIAEYIRMRSMEITDKAMLGRGVSAAPFLLPSLLRKSSCSAILKAAPGGIPAKKEGSLCLSGLIVRAISSP